MTPQDASQERGPGDMQEERVSPDPAGRGFGEITEVHVEHADAVAANRAN